MPFVIWSEKKLLIEDQVAGEVTYQVLAEMHHLAPKRAHQHPGAVTAIALERTTKTDVNMKETEMKRNKTKIPKRNA